MVARDLVWSAESTTATAIAAALRGLLRACHEQATGCVPARVLNLVCVADSGAAGAVSERLAHTGRVHASRTILCALDPDRAAVGAAVALGPALQRARRDSACGIAHGRLGRDGRPLTRGPRDLLPSAPRPTRCTR